MIASLKGIKEINGKRVITNEDRPKLPNGDIDWKAFDELREAHPICIDHSTDMISFKMMTKPSSKGGNLENAQFTELIATALEMLKYLNKSIPCNENDATIHHLMEALICQKKRTLDRKIRGVEGKNLK